MDGFLMSHFINAIVYAILGVVIFAVSFVVLDKMTPYDLWKELVEGHNTALAIFVGLMALGVSVIIAAAVN
jgi:uncharacterized membrane protein YjfL (UPF0719 family)